MATSVSSLPLAGFSSPEALLPQLFSPEHHVPRVLRLARKGALLNHGPVAGDPGVLSLNIAQGCAHRCAFCSARAYPNYPGDDVVALFTNTAERLHAELSTRLHKPRAVYVSPSTDPFMPLAEVQAETARVVKVLAEHDVEAWLMTRGYIRPSAFKTLVAHRDQVKVTFGLTTLERTLQRVLEPLAAPPRLRLRQIAQLRQAGVRVQVEAAPLVPGLSDTRANLESMLEALAQIGVRHVTAGYMFLRSGIRDQLTAALEKHGWHEQVLEAFRTGPVLQAGTIAAARYLPKTRRQRGYAALMALAAGLGMTINVCGLTNPDFATPRRAGAEAPPRQRLLPRI